MTYHIEGHPLGALAACRAADRIVVDAKRRARLLSALAVLVYPVSRSAADYLVTTGARRVMAAQVRQHKTNEALARACARRFEETRPRPGHEGEADG